MLKVEVGYYDFIFPDDTPAAAFDFAQTARRHITKDDKAAKIVIHFEDEEQEEK